MSADDDMDDALRLMTPEEREAMEEYKDDDKANDERIALDDDGDLDNPSVEVEGEGEGEDGDGVDAPPATTDAETQDSEPVEEPEARPTDLVPAYTKEDESRAAKLTSDLEALEDKFNEGEISLEAWRAAKAPLVEEGKALDRKAYGWNLAVEEDAKIYGQTVDAFLAANPDVKNSPDALKHFDEVVKAQASTGIFNHLTDAQFLAASLRIAKESAPKLFRPVSKADASKAKAASEAAKKPAALEHPADKARRLANETALPSLARMPAAAESDAGEGAFAHLVALRNRDPLAHDEAVARLTPAQMDQYLASSE